jgi:hypothetical protein
MTMPLPKEIPGMAPPAALGSVSIGRRSAHARLTDLQPASPPSNDADDLFFAKGGASAESFRPPYRRFGEAPQPAPRESAKVVELRLAEEPAHSLKAAELSPLDRAFLDYHHRALVEGLPPDPDFDETAQPATSAAMGANDCAPLADLRAIELRPNRRDTARVDELFARKPRALTEDAPPPIQEHAAAAQPMSVVAAPIEPKSDDLLELPAKGDAAPTMPHAAPPHAAAPSVEPAPVAAEEHASAGETAPSPRANRGRGSLLSPIQEAIIVFGCVALMVSFEVFSRYNALPPPHPATVTVAEQPQAAAPEPQPLAAAIPDLLARGDERLRSGDVVTARLFYERAYDAGNARGAVMMGATYDSKFLASIGVYGLRGNDRTAMEWYRRASELGDHEAPAVPAAKTK